MAPLCTQADVEMYGHVDFTNEPEPSITAAIAAISQQVEDYCGRRFIKQGAAAAATFNGPGTHLLQLLRWPNVSITSVAENGNTLTAGTDYLLDDENGQLRRIGGSSANLRRWTYRPGGIIVTYDGGYDAPTTAYVDGEVPADLRRIVATAVLRIYRSAAAWAATPAGAGPLKGVTLEGVGSVQYETGKGETAGGNAGDTTELLDAEKKALAPYVRRVM